MQYTALGELIKSEREKLGWDQSALAISMNMKQQSISRWEKGASRPVYDSCLILAKVMNIDPTQILSLAGYETDKPVRTLITTALPLSSLTAESFEHFCQSLIQALNPGADVVRYGSQGDDQEGIDLISKLKSDIKDYQCKRHKQFGPSDVKSVVKDTSFESSHHHLLLARRATPAARKAMLEYEDWSLWDAEDITNKIKSIIPRSEALRIIDTFFPRWRKELLGEEEPSPWLTPRQFFTPFANKIKIFSHDWAFVGRNADLDTLKAFQGSDRSSIILSGRGGLGKSRLLREFSRDLKENIYLLSMGADVKPSDFELLPDNSTLIIDDAHECSELRQVLYGIAATKRNVKVILSTRPYGVTQCQLDLTRSGVGYEEGSLLKLSELSVDEARQLSAEILVNAGLDETLAEQIGRATKDCPLATVIGSKLVATGKIKPVLLNNDDEFRRHLFGTFRNIITGEVGGSKNADGIRELLSLIATLQPVDPNSPDFQEAASVLLERRFITIQRDIRDLEDSGVLLRRKNEIRIAPDLLADYIRSDVTYDDRAGRPTGYVEEVFRVVKDDLATNLLVNLSQLDWRIASAGTQSALLDEVWASLEKEFRESGIYGRQAILDDMAKVSYYQPKRVLGIVRIAINEPTEKLEDRKGISFTEPSYNDVLNKIPAVLRYVAYNNEYLPEVLNILKDLTLRDTRRQSQYPEHPLRVMTELVGIEPGKPVSYIEQAVDYVLGWLDELPVPNFTPFDPLDAVLQTEGHESEFHGTTFTLKPYKVNAEAVKKIRDKVIDAAFKTIVMKSPAEAVRALKTLHEALRGPWGDDVTDEERARWLPSQIELLEKLKEIALNDKLDPFVMVELRNTVSWHANFSKSDTRKAAQAVLAIIPTTIEYELSRAIVDSWGFTFERDGNSYRRDQVAFQKWRDGLASELLAIYGGNFSALVQKLEERTTTLNGIDIGQGGDIGQLAAVMVRFSPDFGIYLNEYILENNKTSLSLCYGIVATALANNGRYDVALDFADKAIEIQDKILLRAISWSIGWGSYGVSVSERELGIITELIQIKDTSVRKNLVRVIERFSPDEKAVAIETILSIPFDGAPEVAHEVIGQFVQRAPFGIDDLSRQQIVNILSSLLPIDDISDYHIESFLGELSSIEPELTVDFLMSRVEYAESLDELDDYKPMSFSFSGRGRLAVNKTAFYEKILRKVRDWANVKTNTWIRGMYGPDLFKAISAGYDQVTLKVLNEWFESPERRHFESAASLLGEVDRSFLWNNAEYIINVLEKSEKHGDSCYKRVSSEMHGVAYQGGKMGTPGQPFPEDIEQRDKSLEQMNRLAVGSPAYRFYKSLYEIALGNIKRDSVEEEDLFDD